MAAATVVVIAVAMAAATVVVILNLILHTQKNPLVQRAGKIEVTETLLKTLIMKAEEVGEKEGVPMRIISQMTKISNPFLQAMKLI
jgi:hypothetical protein